MVKVSKKIISFILVLVMLIVGVPFQKAKAEEKGGIYYMPKGEKSAYCECLDEALQACYQKGGMISIEEDRHLDFPKEVNYGYINKDTTLVVNKDATVTIGENGFRLDGNLKIFGTVDLLNSEGILYGNGEIEEIWDGKLVRKPYRIDTEKESICLDAKEIAYGQQLSEAVITKEQIHWQSPIEGKWQFLHPEQKPQAGTDCYDLVFKPKYPMTYKEQIFEQSGRVKVNQTIPVMAKAETLTLHAGENLPAVYPEVSFVNPVTGEEVSGEFSFDQLVQLDEKTGMQKAEGTFVPQDSNYASVTAYIPVDIQTVKPQIVTEPLVRNQGVYGQSLEEIHLLDGKCVNPYTGETLTGTWEWKNPAERLQLGKGVYRLLFFPKAKGYETVELEMEIETLPRVMEDFEWPTCSDLTYGESLADATLSFEKNDYGIFYWENSNLCPEVKNNGARLVFRPSNTEIYDWSKLAGYDPSNRTVTVTIPVCVKLSSGQLPEIQASEITEGESGESESAGKSAGKSDEEGQYQIKQQVSKTNLETESDQAAFVITKMVSKASKIRTITVKKTRIVKCRKKKRCVQLCWKKVKGATYQLQCSTNQKWGKSKKRNIRKNKATIRNIKKNKKYYIRIRCVRQMDGRKYYSKWSTRKVLG